MGLRERLVNQASAAKTATFQTTAQAHEPVGSDLVVYLNVSAVSGTTPTLDVTVQWSDDGGTTWFSADPSDAFTQITAAATKAKRFTAKAATWRLNCAIGGTTPSFTIVASSVAIF